MNDFAKWGPEGHRDYYRCVESGLRQRLERTNAPGKILFLLSAIMDAKFAYLGGNDDNGDGRRDEAGGNR